jgi:tight adherence protein B
MIAVVLVAACAFAAVFLVAAAGGGPVVQRRLAEAAPQGTRTTEALQAAARKTVARTRGRRALPGALGARLAQAGLPEQPWVLAAAAGVLAAGGGLALYAALGDLPPALFVAAVGAAAPFVWVEVRRRARMRKAGRQFPQALDMVASALRAGHAFAAGLEMAADETPAPLGRELRRIYEEQSLGLSTGDALRHLATRLGTMDGRLFTMAVIIQREAGGNLAEVLDRIRETILRRIQLEGQLRALTAQGRYSGWILSGMPIVLGMLIWFLNPGYMERLIDRPIGRALLAGAGGLQLLGCLIIRRIVRLQY